MVSTQLPVLWLTLRQFGAWRSTRVVALFAATPILFGLIFLLNSNNTTPDTFLGDVFNQFMAPTVIPLATLILATATLGNELSDRTIVYLIIKPISTIRIVLEKFVGTFLVTSMAILVGLLITWLVVVAGPGTPSGAALGSMFVGALIGVAAYGALFLFVSLIVPRALLVGVIYVLLWESLLARFIPGIRILSVRHFVQSIFIHILGDADVKIAQSNALVSSLIVMVLLVVVSLGLAAFRLRQMNLD
ncbi:MAG: ABC transporter permease subunit [Nitrolancea sp.]